MYLDPTKLFNFSSLTNLPVKDRQSLKQVSWLLYNCFSVHIVNYTMYIIHAAYMSYILLYICSYVIQLYSYTVIQLYSYTVIQLCSYTVIQLYSYTVIQLYSYTVIQLYSCIFFSLLNIAKNNGLNDNTYHFVFISVHAIRPHFILKLVNSFRVWVVDWTSLTDSFDLI